jgi:putative spermidine/putrescine transport system substrate-binding protein
MGERRRGVEDEVSWLAERWSKGELSRREAIGRMLVLGLSVPAAVQVLQACGGESPSRSSSSAAGQNFKGQTLVVTSYGGTWQQFMESDHIPDFEDRTGAKVELAVGLAKDWFAKMRAAGPDNPPYDVFVTNETYIAQLRQEGFFIPLPKDKIPNLANVVPALRMPNDNGVLGLVGPFGIGYRTDKITEKPSSFLDLAKYGSKSAIYTIGNSGEPQHVMLMAKIQTGDPKNWQAGMDWIAKNLCSAKQDDFSGTMQTQLEQGEVWAGFIDAPDWALLKNKGLPVGFVKPKEGWGGMFEQDMNVTKGSKVKDLAFAFIDYWLSEPVQRKWAEHFWWTPANKNVKIGGQLAQLIPVTQDTLGQIPRWDYIWLNTSGARDDMVKVWNQRMTGHC